MEISVLDPTRIDDWDAKIAALPGSSFFHTQAWARVLQAAYGYTPMYFALVDSGIMKALLPMMEVSSFLTGKRGVSLPFTDYCQPLVPHEQVFFALFDAVKREAKTRGWKYIDLRLTNGILKKEIPSLFFHGHVLDIGVGQEQLFGQFSDTTRRNIRKAEKQGVEVKLENTLEALQAFYGMNCMTRQRHGLPPQPWHFFEGVHREIIARGMGITALARHEGKPVSANVYFRYGEKALFKFGASDMRYQHLRAGNLVMWEAIKFYAGKGCKCISFGRTEPENKGLRRFKEGWGTKETDITYYRFDLASAAFVTENDSVSHSRREMFSRLPLPALRMLGNLFYRHVG
jgi:hypothetical protein